ncbi:hypothetical protein D3C78_1740220 [compost metagenome]
MLAKALVSQHALQLVGHVLAIRRVKVAAGVAHDLGNRAAAADEYGTAVVHGLQWGKAEALVEAGINERSSVLVEVRQARIRPIEDPGLFEDAKRA